MRRIRSVLIGLLACVGAACASVEQSVSANGAVSAAVAVELDAANTAFSAAWVAGDVDALLDAYTTDAVVHPPAGGVLISHESIRPVWDGIVNQQRVGHRLEPTLRQMLGGGEVLEMGRWHAARRNDAGEAPWTSGCYTVIWRNDGGTWRMRYDGWTGVNDASWACRPR